MFPILPFLFSTDVKPDKHARIHSAKVKSPHDISIARLYVVIIVGIRLHKVSQSRPSMVWIEVEKLVILGAYKVM
jgi:hypothetical protein